MHPYFAWVEHLRRRILRVYRRPLHAFTKFQVAYCRRTRPRPLNLFWDTAQMWYPRSPHFVVTPSCKRHNGGLPHSSSSIASHLLCELYSSRPACYPQVLNMPSPRENGSIENEKVEKSSLDLRTEDDNSEVNGEANKQQQPAPHRVRGITSNQGDEVTEAVNLDDESSVGDNDRTMSTVIMPRRFACSRCFRCKGQSKGAPHCRVQMLHLFAPGWFEDQSKRWEPPRGFIKWLRNEGPLIGCTVSKR